MLHKECRRQLDRSPCGHIHPSIGSNVNSRNSQKCKADHMSCIPCWQQLRHSSSSRRIVQKCTGQMMSPGESYARTLHILAPHPSLRCTQFHPETQTSCSSCGTSQSLRPHLAIWYPTRPPDLFHFAFVKHRAMNQLHTPCTHLHDHGTNMLRLFWERKRCSRTCPHKKNHWRHFECSRSSNRLDRLCHVCSVRHSHNVLPSLTLTYTAQYRRDTSLGCSRSNLRPRYSFLQPLSLLPTHPRTQNGL